jgi:hypothetical protein
MEGLIGAQRGFDCIIKPLLKGLEKGLLNSQRQRRRIMRKLIFIWLCLISAMAFVESAVAAGKKIDGVVHIHAGSVAAGIGWSWGGGTLSYQGKDYDFDLKGLSVADVGVSNLTASGVVYNLRRLEDFNGTYRGVKAGVTIAGGVGAIALKNDRGVVIELNGSQQGLKFALGTQGVSIQLKQ